ncbi:fibrobacter succinogenes major paralogous domain-containing protein [uncultured Fibrobacter sp.]|uniref:fibrobacter succinogenes major paralogous domain-containing protein n=1 Tax=uncultured Fibrobacter sp. TaxID=261512 RepID=UPI0025E03DE7|nr:fibrobacter succinogenes major paralogous domain-containing protein [uncultured Fibrobacter sp.]
MRSSFLSITKWVATAVASISIVACTDYVAQMDEDFEAWKEERLTKDDSSSNSQVRSSSGSVKVPELVEGSSSSARSSSSVAVSSSSRAVSSSSVPVSSSSVAAVNSNSFRDSRDGQTYRIVKIGTQVWMAENLNYETANSYCYDDVSSNCSKYGRLYTWAAATAACPSGWHLPTKTEFETLLTVVGGSSPTVGCSSTAGAKLKSTSGWNNSGNGSDAYSFSALPAGRRGSVTYSGDFFYLGESADFWSADDDGGYMSLGYRDDGACVWRGAYNYFAYSVRCLKD